MSRPLRPSLASAMGSQKILTWLLLAAALIVTGCGKRGNPLPPLQRIPVAPTDFAVSRVDHDVYISLTVPVKNIDDVSPADISRVELYAVTALEPPPSTLEADELRKRALLVGTEIVRKPVPPPPPVKEGLPPLPMPPPAPGVDQGTPVVKRERLTDALRVPVTWDEERERPVNRLPEPEVPRPLWAPADASPLRYYFAVAVNSSGRYGPATGFVPAPLGSTSSAPPQPDVVVEENAMTLRWTHPADARGVVEPTPPDLLPSRPVIPGPSPTMYDVYEVSKEPASEGSGIEVPTALTPAPINGLEFTKSDITLGVERCFVVRPVDFVSGIHVRGPASSMGCAAFADTFPPSPPGQLDAVAIQGVISLIWEPSQAADLAGYLLLRGEAGADVLAVLTADPIAPTTYRDETVRPGVRYVYAVVAVDKAGNRSEESNRVEETARP
ncbi:MAG: hypothetical protein ACT4QD_02050 [Acidobacteriota bacterium]